MAKYTFKEVSSRIKNIHLEIQESIGRFSEGKIKSEYVELFEEDITCGNPVCEGGCYWVSEKIIGMVEKNQENSEDSFSCVGREPMGGKNSRRCGNNANIKIQIAYKG